MSNTPRTDGLRKTGWLTMTGAVGTAQNALDLAEELEALNADLIESLKMATDALKLLPRGELIQVLVDPDGFLDMCDGYLGE